VAEFHQILLLLTEAVHRSSSSGIGIRCVLPVLCVDDVTFHTMPLLRVMFIPEQRVDRPSVTADTTGSIPTKFFSTTKTSNLASRLLIVGCAPGRGEV